MSDHNFPALQKHILSLSLSDTWPMAMSEWISSHILYSETPTHCPCGVSINERHYIHNLETDRDTYIGSKCIEHFSHIDIPSSLFEGIKRIREDIEANTNAALVHYAHTMQILKEHESEFLLNTCLSRKLTEKQINWKRILNRKILREVVA